MLLEWKKASIERMRRVYRPEPAVRIPEILLFKGAAIFRTPPVWRGGESGGSTKLVEGGGLGAAQDRSSIAEPLDQIAHRLEIEECLSQRLQTFEGQRAKAILRHGVDRAESPTQ